MDYLEKELPALLVLKPSLNFNLKKQSCVVGVSSLLPIVTVDVVMPWLTCGSFLGLSVMFWYLVLCSGIWELCNYS